MSYIECVNTPMSADIDTLLKQFPPNTIPIPMKNFCDRNRNDTNLIDVGLWDADMFNYVNIEFLFFSKHKDQLFTASYELCKSNMCVATSND